VLEQTGQLRQDVIFSHKIRLSFNCKSRFTL